GRDGGQSSSNTSGGAHGDVHALSIEPNNTDHLICGDAGGVWYSYDAGNRWWKAENLPVSQFYHVSVDMDRPYHVYGGLQDNSSWVGDSQYPGGITNARWENMYGGDGFWMFVDPTDNDYIYAESQGGDDGNLQVTRDGGKSWSNVVSNLAGLPKNSVVSYVEAGHFEDGTAFATFDVHAHGDMKSYAYKTTDFGKSWTGLIAADAPVRGY